MMNSDARTRQKKVHKRSVEVQSVEASNRREFTAYFPLVDVAAIRASFGLLVAHVCVVAKMVAPEADGGPGK